MVNSRARERTLYSQFYYTIISLRWESRVLATRPPGKLYFTFKKKLIEVVFYSQKWKISAPGHKRKVIKQISSGIKLELAPVTCRIHLRLTL